MKDRAQIGQTPARKPQAKEGRFLAILFIFYYLLAAITLLLTARQIRAEEPPASSPVLRAASELDYPPFALVQKDGTADGFSVDLLKAVTQAVGLQVTFSVGPWAEIKEKLALRQIDVLPLVSYTPERDKIYDFTAPYLRMQGTVFVRIGETRINSFADLKDKEVLVMRGDTAHEYAVKEKLSDKLILTADYETAMKLLAAGRHDAVVMQRLVGLMLLKKLATTNIMPLDSAPETDLKLKRQPLQGFQQKFCFAVQEGDHDLLSRLNEGLAIVYADGTYETLYKKWFMPILPQPKIPFREMVISVLSVLIPLVLLMAGLGIWYLKREVARKTASFEQSQQKFRDFMNSATDGFLLYDTDLRLIEINDRALELLPFKVERNQLLGTQLFGEGVNGESERKKALHRVLETGDPCCLEEDFSSAVSGLLHVSMTIFPVPDGIGVILRNITERILTVRDLRKKEEEIRLLLDHTVEAIYGCDLDGCCTFANSACVNTLGYRSSQEIIGRNMHLLTHHSHPDGQQYPEESCEITRAFKEQRTSHHDSEVFWRKDGSSFPVEYWSHPVYQGNAVRGCVVTFVDISERRLAEEERQKLEMKLQQSFKMEAIGTLAGGIAHDFNNILGAILGYTEMAKEESDPRSMVFRNLREVLKAGQRAKDLVRRILAFSRQTSASEFQYLRPGTVILEVEKMLRPSIPSSIEIRLHLAQSAKLIFADPTQIHQILMNLCTNAYHAMEETGGKMDIILSETDLSADEVAHEPGLEAGRFFKLTVQDTGQGIHPEVQLKIFDPFFTTKEVGKGTGMGLSMVHGIIKNHGGCITVESTPGQGAAFHVFLPAVEQVLTADETYQEDLPTGTEKILFVDDEKMLVEMARVMLSKLGYAVTTYNSSLEALEHYQQHPDQFDLVITDQTMPGMTGAEMARRMLQIRPELPIIVCTGYSSVLSEEKAKSIGIREFVVKPMLKKDIAPLIRKVLDEIRPDAEN